MRGGSSSDQELRASDLNHNFVGRAVTIDLPDGSELCTTIEGIQWAQSGPIGVFLAVPYDDDGRRYIELARDAVVMVPRPDDA